MPLIHLTVQKNDLKLAIWEFSNNELSPLENYLTDTYFSDSIAAISLAKRQREIIGTKLLKRTLGIAPLKYESSGKPITEKGHISISHSENMVGIIYADFLVGLDLQIPSKKLYRVRTKFCNLDELERAKTSNDELSFLTIIWATKEAVFKMFGKNLPFAQGMDVHVIDEKSISCVVTTEEVNMQINLTYFWINNQVVVFTSREIALD